MIVLIIRSRRPFFKSRPGKYPLTATLLIAVATLCFSFTPFSGLFSFKSLPTSVILITAAIIGVYVITAEVVKRAFYKKVKL